MSATNIAPLAPDSAPPARVPWAGPVLVGFALAAAMATVVVFVRMPLSQLPLYFAQGYFVLDATSLLFLLVINSVFLGISVYMSSLARRSPDLAPKMKSRTALTLAFMVAMNLGVMANHLLLLWAFIELTTVCAAPLVAQGESLQPRRVAWHYLLYSSMSLALTFLGILCLTRSAHLQGIGMEFAFDKMAQALPPSGDGWRRAASWAWHRCTAGCPRPMRPPPRAPAHCWLRCSSTSASSRCCGCCRSSAGRTPASCCTSCW